MPTATAAILQGRGNPTFTPDGTDPLLLTTPLPTACGKLNVVCATIPLGVGQVATTTSMVASPSPGTAGQVLYRRADRDRGDLRPLTAVTGSFTRPK